MEGKRNILTQGLRVVKAGSKGLQNRKLSALLLSVMIVGILTLSPTLSALMNSVAIGNTGNISLLAITAKSGSATDIQAAINSAVAAGGVGTVYVPAGTFNFYTAGQTWVPVYIPDGVNLIGAPPGATDSSVKVGTSNTVLGVPSYWNTVLVMPVDEPDGTLWFKMGNGSQNPNISSRFANIKLEGYRSINSSSTSNNVGIQIYGIINFRIDHCMFEHTTSGAVSIPLYFQQNLYCSGVIDHNNITNIYGYDNLGNSAYSTVGYGISVGRAYNPDPGFGQPMPYDPPTTMLGQYTNHTVFIENNYFSKWRHCVSSGHSGYYVFRYNVVNQDFGHYSLDVHGLRDTQTGRSGGQGVEVYENNFTNQVDYGGVMQDGGGYGVFFNNYVDTSYHFMTLYDEDQVSSTTWHLIDFYMWGKQGPWTPSVTFPKGTIDPSRNVVEAWNRTAYDPSNPLYPNVDPSWAIAGYKPYAYPFPLTLT